ncbi:MAG: mechanosensitive ion channel family protein, partial [Halobacteriales archaeon]
LPNFVLAAVIIIVGYRLSITAKRYAGRPVYGWIGRESVASTTLRLIKFSIILMSVLLAFRIAFGFSPTSLLLTATVFSAVVGIILAPLVGDIVNGVFVLSDQPYEVGDMVEIVDTGKTGFVEEVTIRYTKIFTVDNTFLVIPNSEIRKRDVVNYSAEDIRTRQTLEVSVTYESDVAKARELLVEAAGETPEVIGTQGSVRIGKGEYPLEPRPFIVEFGDHGVGLALRYWVREPYRLHMVKSKVNEKVWNKFRREGIRIPYPHRHHVFDDTSGEMDVSLERRDEDKTGG